MRIIAFFTCCLLIGDPAFCGMRRSWRTRLSRTQRALRWMG